MEFYGISFIVKFLNTYHLYGKPGTSGENSNCWSMIGKSVVKLEMAYHFLLPLFFFFPDLTNFTVTQDSQLRWCVENQRVWMALRGAGFQPHADPLQDSFDTDHVIKNGHDDGLYSTIFPCVSQAIRWLLSGRDPHIAPLSPGGFALPDFISKATRLQVLITGSIHLVGTAMKVLGPEIVGEV